MNFSKYDGNIHPDEWINDIQTHNSLWDADHERILKDISFTIFKNMNKRKLQSLKYVPERKGGDTSKFISTFRKLCYNAEINDLKEQKKYLFKSLPNNHFDYISSEFYKKMKNVNSTNELIKEFEDIILEESNLIRNESIVALKHVATEKYLSSISNLRYKTGSKSQSSEPDPNSLWKIQFNKEFATYADTSITLQHIKSNNSLGITYYHGRYYEINYYKSPVTEHTEVCCGGNDVNWEFNHSKLKNHQGYLKSNDIINLSIKKTYDNNADVFLRSHDVQFTIGNDTFQEVVCHNERLGGNDEWCIELIHEVNIF
ncbi:hypothetical protein C1645_834942 [Glomus cerebriforme]|uniref:MIR domain-containing protein n=1 Tax=Glomus cerebriforme TaxID=658196 RepID=A0A397S8P5_9GLOM|nr:hypothetical protein C1645_834942 [Glomus cerebriforme]